MLLWMLTLFRQLQTDDASWWVHVILVCVKFLFLVCILWYSLKLFLGLYVYVTPLIRLPYFIRFLNNHLCSSVH